MIAALMVATLSASAQNEVGQFTLQPKVGMNIASLTGSGNKTRVGLAAGLEAEYGVAENFGITAGVLYSMQGSKGKAGDVELKFNMDYINIPILAQYYVVKGLAVKAGVQFGFIARQRAKLDVQGTQFGEGTIDEFFDWFNDLPTTPVENEGKLKKFDFSIPVGLSYEYENFVLDARYNIGVTKTFDNWKEKNSVFQITLGYKFAL